ncbi:MAG TPA: hypothetical protein VLK57_08135 [Pseudonocardia sp.]|nr:hypothetical protein [Pseudonocardia sp.]
MTSMAKKLETTAEREGGSHRPAVPNVGPAMPDGVPAELALIFSTS